MPGNPCLSSQGVQACHQGGHLTCNTRGGGTLFLGTCPVTPSGGLVLRDSQAQSRQGREVLTDMVLPSCYSCASPV